MENDQLKVEFLNDFEDISLSCGEAAIRFPKEVLIDVFHSLYFGKMGKNVLYNGVPIHKLPFDMYNYQQIIMHQRPDFIIECGAYQGGATLFFANLLDMNNKGKVISIDICEREERWYPQVCEHPRVITIQGSSVDPLTVEKVSEIVDGSTSNFVILDSLHTRTHVLQEMHFYKDFLFQGNYLIVEDGNLNGHPLPPDLHKQTKLEGGPYEAIEEFMQQNDEFLIDRKIEKTYPFTYAPSGYLVKKQD